jgi:hypothetical protein
VGGTGGVESRGGHGGSHRLGGLTSTVGQKARDAAGTGDGSGALQEVATG